MTPTSLDAATLQSAAIAGTSSQISAQALLTQIFGTIATNPMSALGVGGGSSLSGGDVLGSIFMFINLGLLTFGSLFVAYKSLVAVTQTAHDGDFLGKAYHTIWVPIRISVGVFSLIPVFNGWSALQVIFLWFGIMGAGLGNLAWQSVATSFEPYNSLVSSTSPNSSFNPKFVPELFKMYACIEAHNDDLKKAGPPSSNLPQWGVSSPQPDPTGAQDKVIYFGSNNGANYECGEINLPSTLQTGNAGAVLAGTTAVTTPNTNVQSLANGGAYFNASVTANIGTVTSAQAQSIVTMAATQFAALQTQVKPSAFAFADAVSAQISASGGATAPAALTPYNPAQMYQMSVNYQQSLVTQFASTMSNLDMSSSMKTAMETSAQQDGFTAAGAWYTTMAAMSYAVNQMAESTGASIAAQAQAPSSDGLDGFDTWDAVYKDISAAEKSTGVTSADTQKQAAAASGDSNGAWALIVKMLPAQWSSFCANPGQGIVNWMVNDNSNLPVILRMKNIGDNGTAWSEVLITAVGGLEGGTQGVSDTWEAWLAKKTGAAVPAEIALGAMKPWIDYTLFISKLALGAFVTLSLFIPLIPFLVYLGQVISWLIGVIEGVAAAPFLAFAHLDASGEEGLGQRTNYGYTFALQSFMRPVMLVFGFVVASKLTDTMGGFLMNIYPMVIANVQMNSVTGLLSIFVLLIFFMMLSVSVINSCMSVMYVIPEALWHFMGAQTSATVQTGRDTANTTHGVADKIIGTQAFMQIGKNIAGDTRGEGGNGAAGLRGKTKEEKAKES